MFLAVLRAKKQRDEEECLLFPVEQRKAPQEQYPWHQLQPPFPRPTKTQLPAMGQLPKDWKWGPDFQPAILRWLSELQWLPRDDNLPEAHRQVSFRELALDLESYTGRPLPPTPQTRFKGGEMSLQEKDRVLRLAVSLRGKAAGRESILPAGFTNRCRSLVPLGAGTTAGVKGRPVFTRPAAVWHHLRRMQQYSAARWAQQQQVMVARQQSKRRRAQGTKTKPARAQQPRKRSAWARVERSARRGRTLATFMRAQCSHQGQGVAHNTVSPKKQTLQQDRRTVTGRRSSPRYRSAQWRDALSRGHDCPASGSARYTNTDNARRVLLWVGGCGTAVPGGMPGIHDRRWPCGASSGGHGERRPTPPGRGAHRQRRGADGSGHWPQDRTECGPTSEEGWTQPPPPPCQEDALSAAGRCQARKSRDRGDITPKPQRFWLRRGPLPRPEQAPEAAPQFVRAVCFVFFKLAPQATAGGHGPMQASLFNTVLPTPTHPPTHTHTHTHTLHIPKRLVDYRAVQCHPPRPKDANIVCTAVRSKQGFPLVWKQIFLNTQTPTCNTRNARPCRTTPTSPPHYLTGGLTSN